MNKISKIALVTLLAITPTITNAMAEDGTIQFDGAVSASTCEIKGGGEGVTTGGGTPDFTVTLPTVAVTALNGKVGKVAGQKPFWISLSGTECTNGDAKFYFEPASSQKWLSDSGALKNDITPTNGGADKVEVRLTTTDNTPINVKMVNSDASALVQTITNNKAQFDFYAMYVSTAETVGAGKVHSQVVYSITYP